MFLARLIAESEDLLICDLAETYGIYDYESMKPSLIATLAVGLPESSRIVRKYSKVDLTLDQILLALIYDSLNGLIWGMGGKKRGKKPERILLKLMKTNEKKAKDELMSFASPEEYEEWRRKKEESWKNG